MTVYQSADGTWIYFNGAIKHHCGSELEAVTMSTVAEQKVVRGQTVQKWATMLAGLDDWLATLNAKLLTHSAANEPTNEDLAPLGITQADFRNGVLLLLKLNDVIVGTAISNADHTDVLSRLRTDAE